MGPKARQVGVCSEDNILTKKNLATTVGAGIIEHETRLEALHLNEKVQLISSSLHFTSFWQSH
jgi:hypothetical protein